MRRISYRDPVCACRCAICGDGISHGGDCFDTELGPICMEDSCVFGGQKELASSVKLVILGTLPGCNEYINAQRRDRQLGARLKREAGADGHVLRSLLC